MNMTEEEQREILYNATKTNAISDLTDEGRMVVIHFAGGAAKADLDSKESKSLSEAEWKAVSYLCGVFAIQRSHGKTHQDIHKDLLALGLDAKAATHIAEHIERSFQTNQQKERSKRKRQKALDIFGGGLALSVGLVLIPLGMAFSAPLMGLGGLSMSIYGIYSLMKGLQTKVDT